MQTQSQKIIKKATDEGKMPIPYLKPAIRQENANGKMSVVGTGPHFVKFIDDKIVNGKEYKTEIERLEVEYIFEEKGIKKRYSVPLKNVNGEPHYIVQRMADVNYGEELVLEYKRDGLKGFISIERPSAEKVIQEDELDPEDMEVPEIKKPIASEDEIPVIEDAEEPEVKKVVPMDKGKAQDAEEVFGGNVPGTDTEEEIDLNSIPF